MAGALTSLGVKPAGYDGAMDVGSVFAAAQVQARSLLAVHADWVELVAGALIRHKKLTGDEIRELRPAVTTLPERVAS